MVWEDLVVRLVWWEEIWCGPSNVLRSGGREREFQYDVRMRSPYKGMRMYENSKGETGRQRNE
jgi:hypothetical protein